MSGGTGVSLPRGSQEAVARPGPRAFAVACVAGLSSALTSCVTPAPEQMAGPAVTIDEIAAGIETHIAAESKTGGGYFRLQHEGRELSLELVRVHMEYLSYLGDGVSFACVDLVGTDGPVYDVDFFMKGPPGSMKVTETSIHKLDGKPLYTWEQRPNGTWHRVPVKEASRRLLGVVDGADEFEFVYRAALPEIEGEARIWVPLAESDAFQRVEITGITAPDPRRELDEAEHGNKVLFMSAGPADSGKAIEIRYRVNRLEKSDYPAGEAAPEKHLDSEILVPDSGTFRAIAAEVTRGITTPRARARALYDFVIREVRYAKYGTGWGAGDAVYACDARSGNCTDFHAYFIALARAADIPARFAIGASIPSERDEGGIDGYHCWAEFFADGKWVPVDISEADKHASLVDYYFGHHPANRIELSKGRDLVVDPQPASGPINFLAYPVMEVNGNPVKVRTQFSFRRLR
ncbi:MAG TPA: transglutaminase-like domain-containing protein [Opitutaceae bacterium]